MAFSNGNIPWNKGYSGYQVKKDIIGSRNPNWKGGKYLTLDGYIFIRTYGKPKLEHRYIVEQILGRKLRKDEVVHHIDANKQNNDSKNLFVYTRSVHRWLENKFAELYKKEHFNSDESRSEFVKLYGNIGTDMGNCHGKLTGVTVA